MLHDLVRYGGEQDTSSRFVLVFVFHLDTSTRQEDVQGAVAPRGKGAV